MGENQNPYDDVVDLRVLFQILWGGRRLILISTVAATAIAILIALILPNIYRSQALLAPNDQEAAGGLSALAAQYGGLASLAGINLSDGSGGKTGIAIEVLQSRKFIADFVERRDILVPLMAARSWDAITKELEIDNDLYDLSSKSWVRDVDPPKPVVPSRQEAFEAFRESLVVAQDKNNGLVTVTFEHLSPLLAKQWVDWMVADLNETIKEQDVNEAMQAIEYLNFQAESTSIAGLREVFFRLIEEQMKVVLLANVTDEYVFKTIDPAVAAEEEAKPRRLLIVAVGLFLGFALGILAAVIGARRRQEPEDARA